MRVGVLLAVILVPLVAWALVEVVRRRRARFLRAHRARVIGDSLDRARAKQTEQGLDPFAPPDAE